LHIVPAVVGEFDDVVRAVHVHHARDIRQACDRAEGPLGLTDQLLPLLSVAYVHRDMSGCATAVDDLLGRRGVFLEVGNDDTGPFAGTAESDRPTDPLCCSGHNSDFFFHALHAHVIPQGCAHVIPHREGEGVALGVVLTVGRLLPSQRTGGSWIGEENVQRGRRDGDLGSLACGPVAE
jgi:hypothetical protein